MFAVLLALLATSPSASAVSDSPLWGKLTPGPYSVGFRQIDRYDHSRPYRPARGLDGSTRSGERSRPMRISIWYPATVVPAAAKPLTFGDYVGMVGGENRLGPVTETARAAGEQTFFQFPLFRDLNVEQRDRVKRMSGRAYRDLAPAFSSARGWEKFPAILYSLGSTALAHITPEYLASHGYIVAQMPRLGAYSGLLPENRDGRDLDTKIRDTDFLIDALHGVPTADLTNIGVLGFSAGGRWALSEAMKPGDVRAVVSLDSVMLFKDATAEAWRRFPFFDADAVRVPVLHMIRREWVPREDRVLWEQMRYAERTSMVFEDPSLDHLDFQSAGYATTLVGTRPKNAAAVATAFETFNRYTLAFFDAHLKGDAAAKAFLAKSPEENGMPAGFVTMTSSKALPAPITDLQLLSEIAEGGIASAVVALRRAWKERGEPPASEEAVNLAGYFVLNGARPADSLQLFELNIEAHPDSANAYDSASDGYLAVGQRDKALAYTRRAQSLLDGDRSLTPERRDLIRRSIEEKLETLTRKSS